jgi:hypothetical protein
MGEASALPVSLDVGVTVSVSQAELATNMTILCLLSPALTWPPATRLRYYSDFDSFAADVPSNLSIYNAGVAFFAQPTHPQTLAVARVFQSSTGGYTYQSFAQELVNIAQDAKNAGNPIYAWALDATYRDQTTTTTTTTTTTA